MPEHKGPRGRPSARCAIYTRKSSEEGLEQEFNSLDAQREACEAYIQSQKHAGWIALAEMYDDGGISGGTMDRPALQRLLADVCAGRVNVIVVYKVDRLTRSLADFAKIVDVLDRHDASFVSVTQQFNTTTSMGRLTLNVLLSFAQFEREIAGERIRDKIAASKKKGMWTGGNVALGYDAIDRKLQVNKSEAKTVRHIFQRYAELGTVSLLKEELDRTGIVGKCRTNKNGQSSDGKGFSRGALYLLLKNRLYCGEIFYQGVAYPGQHDAIVDPNLWQAVQDKLAANRHERTIAAGAQEPSLLAGLIVDARGDCMTPTHAVKQGKRYRYYISSHLNAGDRRQAKIGQRIPAGDIEGLVLDRIRAFFASELEVSGALAPFELDAPIQHVALQRGTKLAQGWKEQSATDLRATVRSLLAQVSIAEDCVCLSLLRSKVLEVLTRKDERTTSALDAEPHDHVRLEIEARLARTGKGKRLVIGSVGSVATDRSLAKLLGDAFSIRDELLSGSDQSIEAMSRRLNLSKGYLTTRVRLTYLAPAIVRLILAGQHPTDLSPTRLLAKSQTLPHDWAEQHRHLGFTAL